MENRASFCKKENIENFNELLLQITRLFCKRY